jgi:hypothetical protein
MPTSFYLLFGIALLLWLAGLIACVVAVRWSIGPVPRRRWLALALALLALAIGYYEFQHFQFSYAQTANGETWSIQSRWFFIALCVLGVISVCVAVLGFTRRRPMPEQVAPHEPPPRLAAGDAGVREGGGR